MGLCFGSQQRLFLAIWVRGLLTPKSFLGVTERMDKKPIKKQPSILTIFTPDSTYTQPTLTNLDKQNSSSLTKLPPSRFHSSKNFSVLTWSSCLQQSMATKGQVDRCRWNFSNNSGSSRTQRLWRLSLPKRQHPSECWEKWPWKSPFGKLCYRFYVLMLTLDVLFPYTILGTFR